LNHHRAMMLLFIHYLQETGRLLLRRCMESIPHRALSATKTIVLKYLQMKCTGFKHRHLKNYVKYIRNGGTGNKYSNNMAVKEMK